jgi:hypothetical protein
LDSDNVPLSTLYTYRFRTLVDRFLNKHKDFTATAMRLRSTRRIRPAPLKLIAGREFCIRELNQSVMAAKRKVR